MHNQKEKMGITTRSMSQKVNIFQFVMNHKLGFISYESFVRINTYYATIQSIDKNEQGENTHHEQEQPDELLNLTPGYMADQSSSPGEVNHTSNINVPVVALFNVNAF